jgi:hypothetical protein
VEDNVSATTFKALARLNALQELSVHISSSIWSRWKDENSCRPDKIYSVRSLIAAGSKAKKFEITGPKCPLFIEYVQSGVEKRKTEMENKAREDAALGTMSHNVYPCHASHPT